MRWGTGLQRHTHHIRTPAISVDPFQILHLICSLSSLDISNTASLQILAFPQILLTQLLINPIIIRRPILLRPLKQSPPIPTNMLRPPPIHTGQQPLIRLTLLQVLQRNVRTAHQRLAQIVEAMFPMMFERGRYIAERVGLVDGC